MSSGFPPMSYDCSDCLQSFILAALSTITAAAASVCRQPACYFQEPPWITESRQSSRRTSEGKPEDISSVTYDLVLLKLLFCCCCCYHASVVVKVTQCCFNRSYHDIYLSIIINISGYSDQQIHLHSNRLRWVWTDRETDSCRERQIWSNIATLAIQLVGSLLAR